MRKSTLLIAILLACVPVLAQNADKETDADEYEGKTYFLAGINYVNNNVYLGRKDTIIVPYISPYIGYMFKSGIYARAAASYTNAPNGHIDLLTFSAGYEHSFGEHFYGGAAFDKFFYNKNSVSVKSNIKSTLGIFGQYTNDVLEPMLTFDYNSTTAKKGDIVLGTSLDHVFYLDNDKLNIIPTLTMYAGTQRYYEEHKRQIETNQNGKKAKNILVNSSGRFEVLDYEISCHFSYTAHHWVFRLIPVYAIPLNPSTVTVGNQVLPERISNSFFVELDVCYRY